MSVLLTLYLCVKKKKKVLLTCHFCKSEMILIEFIIVHKYSSLLSLKGLKR